MRGKERDRDSVCVCVCQYVDVFLCVSISKVRKVIELCFLKENGNNL
jgi:hypothetical protein